MDDEEARRGVQIYNNKRILSSYDFFIIKVRNSLYWRCPSRLMLERYNRFLSARHLDVGPGSGWYLANARWPHDAQLTLLDLNTVSLSHASARLAALHPATVVANVLDPLPEDVGPFDSIGLNFVFHCVPGTWAEKGVALRHLADRLTPDGVLFGSTILGSGVRHNFFGGRIMRLYDQRGVFHNRDDDAAGLETALRRSFSQVEVEVVGTVALFWGRRPV